jgi:DNA replication protein DnaC
VNTNKKGEIKQMNQQTLTRLKEMRLSAMKEEIERQETFGSTLELSFDERMTMIVDKQWERKQNNRLQRLIKNSGIRDTSAVLSDFIESEHREGLKNKLVQYASCSWISNHLNMIVTGATGTGKSFVASALSHEACVQGFKVKYYRTTRLIKELNLAYANAKYERILLELKKSDLLVLDDFGLEPLTQTAAHDLLEVIDDRYTYHKSILFVAQIPVKNWQTLFPDPTVADASLDRVAFNSIRINLKGSSMREQLGEKQLKNYK